MRSIRKLTLGGLAAVMLFAALASSASAWTLVQHGTMTSIGGAGTTANISSMGGSTLTGSFFGFLATTVTCTGFQATGTVQTNPGVSTTIDTAKFTGCSSGGITCTSGGGAAGELVGQGLPWTPDTVTSPTQPTHGGIVVNGTGATPNVFIGTGTTGYFIIPSACAHNLGDCKVSPSGGAQWDLTGNHGITATAAVGWSNANATTTGQATITNQLVQTSSQQGSTCITGGTWSTAGSTVRTGTTIGSGTLIDIV